MNTYMKKRNEKGFTLIELLIAIVVVGILAAVAIVGIGGLTGTSGKSACTATQDSAKAAAAAFYANNNNTSAWTTTNGGPWPKTFTDMTTDKVSAPVNSPAVLEANGSTVAAGTITGSNWTLTIGGGGNAETTFTGC
jgi:prepilin-type N-terminal cleavage/methylation domain-containing protein